MKPNPEVDEIIHLMRQSRMDAIREYLEAVVKFRDKHNSEPQRLFINDLKQMFTETSTMKPK